MFAAARRGSGGPV